MLIYISIQLEALFMDYGPKIVRDDERARELQLRYARFISDILHKLDEGKVSFREADTDRFKKACQYATIYENEDLDLEENFEGVSPRKLAFNSDFVDVLYGLEGGEFEDRKREYKRLMEKEKRGSILFIQSY